MCRKWAIFVGNLGIFGLKKVISVLVTIVTLRQYSVKVVFTTFFNTVNFYSVFYDLFGLKSRFFARSLAKTPLIFSKSVQLSASKRVGR